MKARLLTACRCEQIREISESDNGKMPNEIRVMLSLISPRFSFPTSEEEYTEAPVFTRIFRFEGIEYLITGPLTREERAVYIEVI